MADRDRGSDRGREIDSSSDSDIGRDRGSNTDTEQVTEARQHRPKPRWSA